ncbi:MAG TPA: response regulator, partial [Acidimicrobiales bacterium]
NLLELEERGAGDELIAALFRDAHTLKGSAAVVGLLGFSSVAHAMESLLDDLRQGRRPPEPDLVDALLVAVDGLRRLLPTFLGGGEAAAETDALARQLAQLPPPPPPEPPASSGPADPASIGVTVSAAPVIRVPVGRLEAMTGLVGESAAAHLRLGRAIEHRLGPGAVELPEVHDLSRLLNTLQETTMRARMVPIATVVEPLRRTVREVARRQGKDVRWEVSGESTELDRNVLDRLGEALLHLVRNAVDHGVEAPDVRAATSKPATATVRLHAMQVGPEVVVTISDDGRGIDLDELRGQAGVAPELDEGDTLQLLFRAGFSTAATVTDVSGRGVGLDVVKTAIDALRGRVEVRTLPGQGAEFRLVVPITLAVLRCLLIEAGGSSYAVPMHSVATVLGPGEAATSIVGRPAVAVAGGQIAVSDLGATLGGPPEPPARGPVVVVTSADRRHAFRVDRLLRQREVVVKNLSPLLPRIDVLAGASVEPDGSVLYVLDASGLIERARRGGAAGPPRGSADLRGAAASETSSAAVLVVDDAPSVLAMQHAMLSRAGYRVLTAADGQEALAALRSTAIDLVITDLEMPRMDGIELVRAIRSDPGLTETGVIVLTAHGSEDHRRAGMEAGADAYVVKSPFDQAAFLALVARLVGPPIGGGRP